MLPDNGLKGSISVQSINNLDRVENMDLSNNEITALPPMSGMDALESLNVSNNRLDFASLQFQGDLLSLTAYTPQAVLLEKESLLIDEGEDGEIDRRVGGVGNVYTWLENGEPIEGGVNGLLGFNEAQFVDEGQYSVRVTNSSVPGLIIETEPVQVFVSSLERDIATLLELYETLEGENWADASGSPIIGWGDGAHITQWSFVTLDPGASRVEQVRLPGVGLVGDLPTVITTMTSVSVLDLSNNALTYVPDLTGMRSLVNLNIANNNLQYESLQQNIGIESYNFSGQKVLLDASTTKVPAGQDYDFTVPVRGENLTYQWFFEGVLVASTSDDTYTIQDIGIENMGDYNLIVTDQLISAIEPGFTLVTQTQEILASANISGKVIDIDGAPVLDGEVSLWRIREIGTAYDSIGTYPYIGDEYLIPDVVLGDYIHWVITDLNKHLPTYYQSSFTWSVADPVILRQNISDLDIRVINIPPPLIPGPDNDNTIAGFLELDTDLFPPGTFGDGNRTLARRRVKRAGCAFNRARFVDRGEDDVVFELIYYTLTDDDGNFIAENLPDGLYRVQIEFPGIPMDPNSFVEFELGGGGTIDQNQINLAAEVKPTGIVVTKIEETGIYRNYFKDLNIFPNPADDYLEITYERLNTEGIMMQVMDLNGAIQIEQEIPKGFDQSVQLEVSHLTPGIYIMTFMDKEQGVRSITSLKFIIER